MYTYIQGSQNGSDMASWKNGNVMINSECMIPLLAILILYLLEKRIYSEDFQIDIRVMIGLPIDNSKHGSLNFVCAFFGKRLWLMYCRHMQKIVKRTWKRYNGKPKSCIKWHLKILIIKENKEKYVMIYYGSYRLHRFLYLSYVTFSWIWRIVA